MKPKTAIVLGALLLLCVLFVVLTSSDVFRRKPTEAETPKEQQILKAPAGAKLVALTVAGPDRTVVFRKTDDKWRITQPIRGSAEGWRVDGIADSIKDLKGTAADVSAATSGLDKPRWTLTAVYRASDGKETTQKLLVGLPRPMESDQTYVAVGEGKPCVVKVDFAYKLDRPLSEFRDNTVLDLKSDKIVALKVSGRQNYELVKRDGKWGIIQPVSAKADADAVKKVLDKVASLRASEFLPEPPSDLAPYGLDKPVLTVEVEMEAETPASAPTTATSKPAPPKPGPKYVLALGGRSRLGDKLYAKLADSPEVFTVDKDLLKDLGPALGDLRDKKVLDVQADAVTGIDLALPGGKVALAKSDGTWRMTSPLAGPAGADAVKKLLDKMSALKAAEFKDEALAPEVYGLDKPAATIALRLAGQNETVTLIVGGRSASGEMTFVKTAAARSVAVVPTSECADLLAEGATYWDPQLFKLPAEAKVVGLELRRTDGTFNLARDPNGDWKLSAPLAAPADKDQLNKVIDHLESLKADKVVALARQAPDQYARAAAIMQVVFTSETPPPPEPTSEPTTQATQPTTRTTQPATKPAPKPISHTYKVTVAKIGLHSYAWVDGKDIVAVGEFAPSLYDDLAGELRSRVVWTIEPDHTRGVKLASGDETLDLRKEQDAWKYVADPYVKIDAEKVISFLKDIKELKAERFLTNKGGDEAKYGLDKPWLKLELTDRDGKKTSLTVSNTGQTATKDRYATASTVPGVMVISADVVGKLGKKLKDFTK